MPGGKLLVLVVEAGELLLAVLVGDLERGVASNTSLLRQLLVLLVELGTVVLGLGKLGLGLLKLLVEVGQLLLVAIVLSLNELELLASVGEHDHMVDDLAAQTGELLVTLLDLLVQGLVLNLELLVIDQVEALGELLLLLQDLLLVLETVSEGDVLETVLMNFLIFGLISLFPLLDDFLGKLLTSAAVHSIHSDGSLQLFELLLDLRALRLLLVQFVLKLTSHAVVTILCLFQVVTDLMDVSESVQVLVLVKHLVSVLLVVTVVVIHDNDLALAIFIDLLELGVLASLILDSLDKLTLHGRMARQVAHATIEFIVVLAIFF